MERRAQLAMLVLSIRRGVREVTGVLEEVNRGARQRTFPATLLRVFRTIEHDALATGLERLGEFARAAKDLGGRLLDPGPVGRRVELLLEAASELERVADDVEAGRRHKIDETLAQRLASAESEPSAA